MQLNLTSKTPEQHEFRTKVPKSTQESQQNRCASSLGQPQTSQRQFPVAGANKNKYCAPGKTQHICSIYSTCLQLPLRVVLGPLRGDFPSPLTLAERNCKPTNCWAPFIPQLTLQRGPTLNSHKTRGAFWAASLADFAKYLKRLAWRNPNSWPGYQLVPVSGLPSRKLCISWTASIWQFCKTKRYKSLKYLYTPCKWGEKENIRTYLICLSIWYIKEIFNIPLYRTSLRLRRAVFMASDAASAALVKIRAMDSRITTSQIFHDPRFWPPEPKPCKCSRASRDVELLNKPTQLAAGEHCTCHWWFLSWEHDASVGALVATD